MDVLLFLLPLAIVLGAIGLLAFFWAMKNRQFEDLDGAAARILFDEDPVADTAVDIANSSSSQEAEPMSHP